MCPWPLMRASFQPCHTHSCWRRDWVMGVWCVSVWCCLGPQEGGGNLLLDGWHEEMSDTKAYLHSHGNYQLEQVSVTEWVSVFIYSVFLADDVVNECLCPLFNGITWLDECLFPVFEGIIQLNECLCFMCNGWVSTYSCLITGRWNWQLLVQCHQKVFFGVHGHCTGGHLFS